MANVEVVTVDNKKAGSVELDPSIFEVPVKEHLVHAEVRRQLAVRRAGTHCTKNRAAVSGGGIKPYRQKGTGRARQGSIRAPHYAGGGVAFGPVPHGYVHKLTKKVRRAALTGVLSQCLRDGAMTVVDSLDFDEFKTRRMVQILDKLGLAGQKVLIVLDQARPQVEGSARNIAGVSVIRAEGLNVYDVLRHSKLLVTQAALEGLQARLAAGRGGATT